MQQLWSKKYLMQFNSLGHPVHTHQGNVSKRQTAPLVVTTGRHPAPWEEGALESATAKSLQSCPTLCDPLPGILQARTLEWVAISFSNA